MNPWQIKLLATAFHYELVLLDLHNRQIILMKKFVSTLLCRPTINVALHTIITAFCLPVSMQPKKKRQMNNVPGWTLFSLWESSMHGCAAAHMLIIFASLASRSPSCSLLLLRSPSPILLWYELLFFFPGISWSHPTLCSFSISYPFPSFSLPHSHPFLPPSFSHLSDLNTCIMHGEGKAVRRPACANNAPK